MARRLALLLVCLLLPLAARAADATRSVLDALSGIEAPPDMGRILATPGAEEALQAMAQDERLAFSTRAKAVWALGSFHGAPTRALLAGLITRAGAPQPLRFRAPDALARSSGSAALPELKTALGDSDPVIRVATARALVTHLGPAGLQAVRARRPHETGPFVGRVMDQLLESR